MIDALENGRDVAGQVTPLSAFSRAEGDEDSTALTVTFRSGPSANESRAIVLADKAQREEFVIALVGALGSGWQRGRKRLTCSGADPQARRQMRPNICCNSSIDVHDGRNGVHH
jgi:hypothetical protein